MAKKRLQADVVLPGIPSDGDSQRPYTAPNQFYLN
jgi:hypothetical protein